MIELMVGFAISVVLIIALFFIMGLVIMVAIAIGIITTKMNEP